MLFCALFIFYLVAAAAEEKDESDDKDPHRVIVEKVAKTVIHMSYSSVNFKRAPFGSSIV